jgi:hypothetical protein
MASRRLLHNKKEKMAEKKPKVKKEPGRIKQLWQVYKLTAKADKNFVPLGILSFVGPMAAGIVIILLFFMDSPLSIFLWSVSTVLFSILLALGVLSRRAERAAFMRISGQPGAVAAVLTATLKRGYSTSEMPVAVDPKSRDAVYRPSWRCSYRRRKLSAPEADSRGRKTQGLKGYPWRDRIRACRK